MIVGVTKSWNRGLACVKVCFGWVFGSSEDSVVLDVDGSFRQFVVCVGAEYLGG